MPTRQLTYLGEAALDIMFRIAKIEAPQKLTSIVNRTGRNVLFLLYSEPFPPLTT